MTPSSEQFAQLAAMFTTDSNPEVQPMMELLLPAHLPVQGGLWLVPYAGREAVNGVSMLVRMQGDSLDIAAIGKGDIDLTGCSSFDDVLSILDVPIGHWIVQPPIDADPTSLLHCDVDCITLLSGADQAAVVGAYRLLKGLIAAAGSEEDLPTIRLVIVGAEERAANDAASRIIQTAHHQLGIQIEAGHPLPAMGSANNVISQISISRNSNIVDFIGRIRSKDESIDMKPNAIEFDSTPDPVFSAQAGLPQEVLVIPDIPSESYDSVVKETKAQEVMEATTEVDDSSKTQKSHSEKEVPSLASYVDGLLGISPRCPSFEHIELAIDGNGCMHLLANACDFRDVSIVVGWLIRHKDLLALACGGLQIDSSTAPIKHIFTDDAASVSDLHGSGVRLHLLAEIEIGGHRGLYSTPLN